MSRGGRNFDIVLVGGGLANSLIALARLSERPQRLAMVEAASALGGNHTWSFHLGDVTEGARSFIEPLIEYRWPGYSVRFPGVTRRLNQGYATVTSRRLHDVVSHAFAESPGSSLVLGSRALNIDARSVTLDNGERLEAQLVVDGRGPERWQPDPKCRYQKFVGLELELAQASPWHEPLLMDAHVPQDDGLHFVYILPFESRRVLIEDTYFSDTPELDKLELERRVIEYAESSGLCIDAVARSEAGVLPLPLRPPRAQRSQGPLLSGFHGGWFHPTTGYSFPLATRLAEYIRGKPADAVLGPGLSTMLGERARQQRYFCFLNRLLYAGFPPQQRINVLERFYRLPDDTIRRFYALNTTAGDRARILCGRPPSGLSLSHALVS